MKTNKLSSIELVELDSDQLIKTHGGWIALLYPIAISYVIFDIALNPQKSYNAFKAGWNSF